MTPGEKFLKLQQLALKERFRPDMLWAMLNGAGSLYLAQRGSAWCIVTIVGMLFNLFPYMIPLRAYEAYAKRLDEEPDIQE